VIANNKLPEMIKKQLQEQPEQEVPERLWYKIESTIREKNEKRNLLQRILAYSAAPAIAVTALAIFVSVQVIDSRNIEQDVNNYLQSLYYLDTSISDSNYL
jgi:hypothetical protein